MADDSDVMEKEITTIPEVLADRIRLAPSAAKVAEQLRARDVDTVVLTGCGDSFFACEAVELAFRRFAQMNVRVEHAMHFSRYSVRYLPPRSAVIAVSFSGKVGRSIEALKQATAFGHLAVAVTGDPGSPLAHSADVLLSSEIPTFGFSPGTSTYTASIATLLTLGNELGLSAAAGTTAAGTELRRFGEQLAALPQAASQTLALSREPAEEAARRLVDANMVTFLGAGPNEASAKFGAAKMFEGPQLLALSTNLEEWAHEQYFITRPNDPVVVIAPTGASSDRAAEILQEITYVGGLPIYVSDRAPELPAVYLPIASGQDEATSAAVSSIPLSWLGLHLMRLRGRRSYNFPSEDAKSEHYETIHRPTMGVPA